MEGKAIVVGLVLLVEAFVVIASAGVVSPQHKQVLPPLLLPREKSCPVAEDIVPCLCTVSAELQGLQLDCSLVQDETQLRSVFQARFPDTDFLELVIEQDKSDPNTNLTTIKQGTLGDAVSFQSVRISGTKLESMESYALSNSYQTLTYLDLTNNNIEDFPFASLPRYVALKTFIIEANSVASLQYIISSSLQVLSASFNPLSTLPASTLKGSSALSEVYLGHADLLALEPGHFTHLENLTTLDLGGNTITALEEAAIVTASHTVSYLNLNSNQLTFVRHDAISGLSSNATLTLRNNDLTTLEEESWLHIFQQLYPDGVIDLAGNPLVCGCDLAWIMLDPQDRYLPLITDTTRCGVDGPILIFLDRAFFEQQCVFP